MLTQEIEQNLKLLERLCKGAVKAWPRFPEEAMDRLEQAQALIDEIVDYLDRPMGERKSR